MKPEQRQITVVDNCGGYRIQAKSYSAIVSPQSVVNATAMALNLELADRRKVELLAPTWIRAELESRGFKLEKAKTDF